MALRPKIYLETSVVSYAVGRLSSSVHSLSRQLITRAWWSERLPTLDPYVSPLVIEEVSDGDTRLALERRRLINRYPVLNISLEAERLAELYIDLRIVPKKAYRDALHIALASVHEMEYLVTWNCKHIAGADVRRKLALANRMEAVTLPTICTPEELQ